MPAFPQRSTAAKNMTLPEAGAQSHPEVPAELKWTQNSDSPTFLAGRDEAFDYAVSASASTAPACISLHRNSCWVVLVGLFYFSADTILLVQMETLWPVDVTTARGAK